MPGRFRSIATILLLLVGAARSDEPGRGTAVDPRAMSDFENRVRPLLAEHCVRCHGSRKQESNLRLDSRAAMMQGGESGPAIVPGSPEASLLVRAIRREGDLEMPPDAPLDAEQVATLSRWIADGAPWPAAESASAPIRRGGINDEDRAFWSFRPVRPPTPPDVRDPGWVRTPVDRYILAALESRGLRPVKPADRRTLIRRATFDLTGLPPTVADVEAFLDDRSPDAFERVVDRLLASPSYGERWGRHWLDVARYADTAGETADYPVVEAHRYRDYVIGAFNRDLPYDEFVREQVAGDILARGETGPSYARKVTATGFLALSRRFGFDSEKYHYLTIQDTIDTTGQAFLGLTLGCARCHDHKYDPVSMRDYYALYGIFDGTRYPFAGSEQKPNMRSMAALAPRAEAGAPVAPKGVVIETLDEMDGDFELQKPSAGGSLGCLVSPWLFEGQPDVVGDAQSPLRTPTGRAGHAGVRLPGDAGDHRLWQRVWPSRDAKDSRRLHVNLDFRTHGGEAPGRYRLALGHGTDGTTAVAIEIGTTAILGSDGGAMRPLRSIRTGTWYNLRLTLDLGRRTYRAEVGMKEDVTTVDGRSFASGWDCVIDTVNIDGRASTTGARPALDVDNIAVVEASIDSDGAHREAVELAYAVAEGTPGDARIQKRGEPTRPGDVVPRRFLEVLGGDSLPPGAEGSGRRELAEWLGRPENPLTARVMVNRIWSWHFGAGLVATENDFGRRGRRPSHPELLDDLAHRFMAGGWSIKAMHRLIMLSSTYQLASESDPALAASDPEGALLGRFPRRRLDAESIRDAILMIGGGLDRSPGGPHPFPKVGTTFTQHAPFAAVYPSDRRSVYLMTQRIRRHPFLALFDGPDPNASTPHRVPTTVPTQALFFLNDPFVHQQAEGFARRLLASPGSDRDRIALAHRMALGREPCGNEVDRASNFLARYRSQLEVDGVASSEHDRLCWSALARTMFAADEFLFLD